MEKKITISLFVLLIIAVLVICGLASKVKKLSIQVQELTSKTEEDNIQDDEGIEVNDFLQFNVPLYKVEDVAIEKAVCASMALDIDFVFDLDADGQLDKISVELSETNKKIIFKLNGREFENGKEMNGAELYLVDLNKFDNSVEVVIFDQGNDNDPHYLIYGKSGSRMKLIEDIEGSPLYIDQSEQVVAHTNGLPYTNPLVFDKYYKFEDGNLEKYDLSPSRTNGKWFTSGGSLFASEGTNKYDAIVSSKNTNTTSKKNATKSNNTKNKNMQNEVNNTSIEEDAQMRKLSENEKFKIISFTDNLEIEIELENGEKGYIIKP